MKIKEWRELTEKKKNTNFEQVTKKTFKSSQFLKAKKDFWTPLRKYLESAAEAKLALAVAVVEEVGDLGEPARESFALTSLSSSLIVSNILDALCLMTLIYCGGATSVMNFAMRELAILSNIC